MCWPCPAMWRPTSSTGELASRCSTFPPGGRCGSSRATRSARRCRTSREEIAVPFRGDMPDIVLQLLAAKQGLDPLRDFRIRYVPTPMEAMQLLITRRVSHALLTEPGVSLAMRKTRSFPVGLVAPDLHRGADLQQEWGRLYQRAPRVPQAGIAAVGAVRGQPQVLAAVEQAYARSLAWCRNNAMECGRMMARHIDLLTPDAVADAISVSQMNVVPALQAREELEFFFGQLMARNPGLLGGKLPAAGFFGGVGGGGGRALVVGGGGGGGAWVRGAPAAAPGPARRPGERRGRRCQPAVAAGYL